MEQLKQLLASADLTSIQDIVARTAPRDENFASVAAPIQALCFLDESYQAMSSEKRPREGFPRRLHDEMVRLLESNRDLPESQRIRYIPGAQIHIDGKRRVMHGCDAVTHIRLKEPLDAPRNVTLRSGAVEWRQQIPAGTLVHRFEEPFPLCASQEATFCACVLPPGSQLCGIVLHLRDAENLKREQCRPGSFA